MKAIKRTVAALLATLMLATSTSFTLAASEYSKEQEVAMGKVNAAGIMTGTDKGFEPEKTLTRAEAAAIIVRMKGISKSSTDAAAGTTLFGDVSASHWASGYINQASNLGIVKGVSATEFRPDDIVTISQFVTMAIRALGAGQLVDSEGTWPTNYVNFANENKLLDDVNAIYTANAKRVEAATIVANTLTAPMWEKVGVKSNGEIEWGKSYSTVAGNIVYTNILNDVLKLTADAAAFDKFSNKDHLAGTTDVLESVDLSNMKVGVTYHYYLNKDGDITGFWIEDDDVEFTKIVKALDANDKITLLVDGKEKEYKLGKVGDPAATLVYYTLNEVPGVNEIADLAKDYADFEGTVTLNDKNEIINMTMISYDQYAVVDEVTKSVVKFNTKDVVNGKDYKTVSPTASQIKYTTDANEYFLTKNGVGISYADLKEGDAIKFYLADSNKKYVGEVISSDDIIEGKVTAKGSDYIKLDGVKYNTVLFDDNGTQATNDDVNLADKVGLNDTIKAYLNKAGKIVMIEEVEEEKSTDGAIVTYIKTVEDKYKEENLEVKLTLMDNTQTDSLTIDKEATYNEFFDGAKSDAQKTALFTSITTAVVAGAKKADGSAKYDDATAFTTAYATLADFDEDAPSSEKEIAGYALAKANVLLGTVICYEINGTELTVLPDDTDVFVEKTASDVNKLVIGRKQAYLALSSGTPVTVTPVYYLADDAVVLNVKNDKDYSKKVEVVDIDSLDDTTIAGATVLGIDKDNKEVDFVVLSNATLSRTSETNFAYIKEISSTKYENKSAQEVVVIYMDGTEKTYTYAKDKADNKSLSLVEHEVYDLTISGDLIMDGKDESQLNDSEDDLIKETLTHTYFEEVIGNRLVLSSAADVEKEYFLADEVLVLNRNGKKVTVSSLDEILAVDYNEADADQDKIFAIWTYTDDTDNSAVVIVYSEADNRSKLTWN